MVTVRPLPVVVVPAETIKLLKVVKTVKGKVLVAVNSTVPAPGAQVELVFPIVKALARSIPPFVMEIDPLLPVPDEPTLIVPETVRIDPDENDNPAVVLFAVGFKLILAATALLTLTVTVTPPLIVTASLAVGID